MTWFKKAEPPLEHDWSNTIPMVPAVQQCNRCGNYKQVGPGYRVNLPNEINLNLTDTVERFTYCTAEALYTQHQLDKQLKGTFNGAWVDGQSKGISLQPDFTKEFFKKLKKNPNTLMYEIPIETYDILKDRFIKEPK